MNNRIKIIFILLCLSLWLISATPLIAQTDYQLLAPIPLDNLDSVSTKATTATYIPGLFRLIIGIAGALAVIRLIYAGIKYMSTDAIGEKSEARGIIEQALWGLLLAMSAWLIVATILGEKALDFNLKIDYPTPGTAPVTAPGGMAGTTCVGCVIVSVPHKTAPEGCAAPGPCRVDPVLNARLVSLNNTLTNFPAPRRQLPLEVTESHPPTRQHEASCHYNGTCVDANFRDRSLANNAQNIKSFIDAAASSNLRAVYEVQTAGRAGQIRNQTGLSESQVIVVPGITGEHFSVYKD